MATEFTIAEAQERLPELLDRVESGENIVITRFGAPAVSLNPVRSRRSIATGGAVGALWAMPIASDLVTTEGDSTFDVGTDFWPDFSG